MALWSAMNVLLDTCALMVLANGPLPPASGKAFGDATEAYVSTAAVWEAAIKCQSGKLRLSLPPLVWFQGLCALYHLVETPLHARILCAAAGLPTIHRDPFDRVLIATAMEKNLTILTSDTVIPTYPGVRTLW
jgi:PIN domain nuclease of toxin-antitoxin system